MAASAERWAIVVPVKRLAAAKTRLVGDPAVRADLAIAMAVDTVAAALRCDVVGTVVVVTDEPVAAATLRELGAQVVADVPDAGLNPALRHGAEAAVTGTDLPIAALASDLPALRHDALGIVLTAASAHRAAIVGDVAGSGTTLLAAAGLASFEPVFGRNSRQAHVAAGAVDLTEAADRSVRRDVDTLDDLRDAARLGCGPATVRALERLGLLG